MERVVIFDGECNLCNVAVNFIMRNDRKRSFRFASLQSELGRAIVTRAGFRPDNISSIVLVVDERVESASTAALSIARMLRFPWSLLAVLRFVPRPLRDSVYAFIAANRYRWFGKRSTCRLPSESERELFL